MAIKPKGGLSRSTAGPMNPNNIPSDVPKPSGARGRDTLIRDTGAGTPRGTGQRPSKFSKGRGLRPSGRKGRANY